MIDLEAQVLRGQAALGQLIRQFLAVNDLKHVQLMTMAHAVTGERWIHSSQISTLKRGATRNLTGFPLYSLALVNRKIWELNEGLCGTPSGTRREDWENKLPMIRPDGQPLDIGDLWRIYFGEMEPPLFAKAEEYSNIDDAKALLICKAIHSFFMRICDKVGIDSLTMTEKAKRYFPSTEPERVKEMRGVLLGVIEMKAPELMDSIDEYAEMLGRLTNQKISVGDLTQLLLDEKSVEDSVAF